MPTFYLDNSQSLAFFLPELVLTIGAVLVFLLDLAVRTHPRRIQILSGCTFVVLGLAALATYHIANRPYQGMDLQEVTAVVRPVALFHKLIVLDPWAIFFKYLSLAITALGVWMAAPSK